MKILFLAPHPVFQERGSPIAVKLALTVLSSRPHVSIDLLSYSEGTDLQLPHVTHYRTRTPRFMSGVRPGASILKIFHDVFFFFSALSLLWENRENQYQLVHAVEEASFMALFFKMLFGVPYIYDMDSSLAMQVVERWPLLRMSQPLLNFMERLVIRHALTVIPVCEALGEIVQRAKGKKPEILSDISLLDTSEGTGLPESIENSLRAEFQITTNEVMALYVGNLEPYQGIDLLMQSFSRVIPVHKDSRLVIVGGREDHVEHYRNWVKAKGFQSRIHLTGMRPLPLLDSFLKEADVLLSPRTLGNNTPMKIYSYLHAGKALVATRLFTHTQVMNDSVAALADPTPEAFSQALLQVFSNKAYRLQLGQRARELAEEKYTFRAFSETLTRIYDKIEKQFFSSDSVQNDRPTEKAA